jgi:hypothetical protein
MSRLRHCGRFCFWRVPLGPWCCAVCDRLIDGPMPKSAEARFWEYVDGVCRWLASRSKAQREESRALLQLFRKGR